MIDKAAAITGQFLFEQKLKERKEQSALEILQRIVNEVEDTYHSRSGELYCLFCEASIEYDGHKDDCTYVAALQLIAGE